MNSPRPFQKGLKIAAFVSYVLAVVCGLTAAVFGDQLAGPVTASFFASMVFFVGVGIVLHVIASVSLPNLKFDR